MHKKIMKKWSGLKFAFLLFFTMMTLCMLLDSKQASALALEGLTLWFSKMIPALLPFMILSGVLIGTGLSDSFAALFSPLLKPLFRLSDSCLYCIIIGFLCGFPMGARVCAQSLEKGKITQKEASLLLAFCNNIGPAYFTGYVMMLFPVQNAWLVLSGMYGIPFLYGLLLRHTLYRDISPALPGTAACTHGQLTAAAVLERRCKSDTRCSARETVDCLTPGRLLLELHASILSGLDAITVLGGYMIFCNLFNLPLGILFQNTSQPALLAGPLIEITSGLSRLPASQKAWAYVALPFGGLSCFAQTYSCIKNTGLSLRNYFFHKLLQTMLTAAFYAFLPIR